MVAARQYGDARTRRRITIGVLGLILLASNACAGPDRWVETYPDIAARARDDPAGFVAAADRQWDDLSGLVGSYQVRARRGVSSRTMDTQIALFGDDLVNIEVLAPTGSSEAYLVSGRREIGYWASDENRLYRGAKKPGEFGRALGVDLEPQVIVAVLMGFAVPRGAADRTAVWDETTRRIRVSGAGATAWLHPVTARYERVVVNTAAGPIDVVYESWSAEGAPVPLRLRIEVPGEGITLDLRLASEWTANPRGLDEAHFEVFAIRGAVEFPLSALVADGGLLRRGLER